MVYSLFVLYILFYSMCSYSCLHRFGFQLMILSIICLILLYSILREPTDICKNYCEKITLKEIADYTVEQFQGYQLVCRKCYN